MKGGRPKNRYSYFGSFVSPSCPTRRICTFIYYEVRGIQCEECYYKTDLTLTISDYFSTKQPKER